MVGELFGDDHARVVVIGDVRKADPADVLAEGGLRCE